jgi:hypothetical protein
MTAKEGTPENRTQNGEGKVEGEEETRRWERAMGAEEQTPVRRGVKGREGGGVTGLVSARDGSKESS